MCLIIDKQIRGGHVNSGITLVTNNDKVLFAL